MFSEAMRIYDHDILKYQQLTNINRDKSEIMRHFTKKIRSSPKNKYPHIVLNGP